MESTKDLELSNTPTKETNTPLFTWKTIIGMVICVVACDFFSTMHGSCKHLYNISNITAWEIVYWRSLALVICNTITAQIDGDSILRIPTNLSWTLLWKVLSGILGLLFVFFETKVMSFSKATAIFYVYPAFAMIFAYYILNERITRYDIISSIVSFIGVIVIVFDPNASKKINDVEVEPIWAPAIPILAAFFCALTDVYTRALGTSVHCTVSPGYFGLGGSLAMPILAFGTFSGNNTITVYSTETIIYLVIISLSGFIGQLLLTKAFQLEKAGRIATITYVQVVNACIIDIIIFHIPIAGMQYFGIFLIIASGGGLMALKGFDIIK